MRHYNKILLSSASVVSVLLSPVEASVFSDISSENSFPTREIQAERTRLFAATFDDSHSGATTKFSATQNGQQHQQAVEQRIAHLEKQMGDEVRNAYAGHTGASLTEDDLAVIITKMAARVMNTPSGMQMATVTHSVEKKRQAAQGDSATADAAPTDADVELEGNLKAVIAATASKAVETIIEYKAAHPDDDISTILDVPEVSTGITATFKEEVAVHQETMQNHVAAIVAAVPAATTPAATTPAAAVPAATTPAATTTPAETTPAVVDPNDSITSLTFSGQKLSDYKNLASLTVPVGMLGTEIKHPNSLNITVTGDKLDTAIDLSKLNVTIGTLNLSGVKNIKDNKVDVSQCLGNVTTVIVSGEISDLTLKSSVTSLTASAKLRTLRGASTALATRTGVTDLTTLAVTGSNTTIPSWITDGSLTKSGATIDVSGLTSLPAKLDVSAVHADVTGLVVGSNITNLIGSSRLTSLTAHSNLVTLQSIDSLTSIVLSGSGTQIPVWATNGSHTAAGASLDIRGMTGLGSASLNLTSGQVLNGDVTEFKSHTTITGTLTLPTAVVKLTVPETATVAGVTGLTELTITGSARTTLPAWVDNDVLADNAATLDVRGMTALVGSAGALSVATITDLVGIKLPAGITGLTVDAGVVSITAPSTLATVADATSLASITLTGAGTTIPAWVTTDSNTAATCTLDLTGMTAITTVNTSGNADLKVIKLPRTVISATLNAAATTIVAGDTLTTLTGPTGLTSITLSGTNTTLPAWTKNEALTGACTLDLTGELNLIGALDLSATGFDISTEISNILVSDKITSLTLPATVDDITASGKVTAITGTAIVDSIKLIDELSTTVPAWATNGTYTEATSTLDLSGMTKLPATLDLSSINSDITKVIVGSNITTLTLPTTVTELTATPSLTTLTSGVLTGGLEGPTALSSITLSGAGAAQDWLKANDTHTAAGCTLNLAGCTGISATLDLSDNNDITSVTLPTAATLVTNLTVGTNCTTLVGTAELATLTAGTSLTSVNSAVNALTSITLTGTGGVPTWITANGNYTDSGCALILTNVDGAAGALDLSGNDDIDALTLPTSHFVTSLKTSATSTLAAVTNAGANLLSIDVGDALTAIDATALTSVTVKGANTTAINAIFTNGTKLGNNVTLDCSGMTNIEAGALDASGYDAQIINFKAPNIGAFALTLADTMVSATVKDNTTDVTSTNGNTVTSLTLVGSTATAIPEWATDGVLTAAGTTLDCSGMTGITTHAIDLSGVDTDVVAVIAPSSMTTGLLTVPATVKTITAPNTLTQSPTATDAALDKIILTGGGATVQTWATNGSLTDTTSELDLSGCTGLGATLDLSTLHSDITVLSVPASVTTLTLPAEVTTLTAKDTLATVTATGLATINLSGSTATIPAWARAHANATALNVSGMTGLGTTLNLSTGSNAVSATNIVNINVPTTVTTLTLPAHATELTAGTALTTLTAGMALATVTGPNALTSITLTGGSASAIPGWVTGDATRTASPCTVDITGASSHATQTVGGNTDIVTLKLPAAVTTLNAGSANTTLLNLEADVGLTPGANIDGLTSITLTGSTAEIPTWITANADYTGASCTLDVSGATLSNVSQTTNGNADITVVKLPTNITTFNANAALTSLEAGDVLATMTTPTTNLVSLKLTGSSASIPTWVTTNGNYTAATCSLDITGMTGVTAVNISGNADITTLKMSYPRLIHAGLTSVNLGSCTDLFLTGGTNVSDVDLSKPTNEGSVATLNLTGMGLAAAPTINHITDGFTAVTTISTAGSGLSDVTNIERNYSKTTITRTASPTSVTR